MARPPRIQFENACYHIMNRGAGRCAIFKRNEHRELFIDLLGEISNRFEIEIHAYCLMDNHYHLLIKTPGPGLSDALKHLGGVYTKRFNRLEKRDGPLFRGRFRAIVIDAYDYLVEVSRYIHRNPVEANIVAMPAQYRWSSFCAYVEPSLRPDWLHTEEVLSKISGTNSVKQYRAFVENPRLLSLKEFYDSRRLPSVLGSKQFKRYISSLGFSADAHGSAEDMIVKIDRIIELTAAYFGENPNNIIGAASGKHSRARVIAIYLARKHSGQSSHTIAERFGVKPSAISATLSRHRSVLESNQELRQAVHYIQELLKVEARAN